MIIEMGRQMNKNHRYILFLTLMPAVFFFSCATSPKPAVMEKPETVIEKENGKKVIGRTEEEIKSLELFTEILDLTESTDDRQSVLPRAEALYDKIIREYPGTPLAQESYWRLVTMYVRDYSPPDYEKADKRYREFLEKYPHSVMKGFIDDTLGNSYYKHAEWNRLLKLTAPVFREYTDKKTPPRAPLLFMYAEANYNLGDLVEAERAYRMAVDLFPETTAGVKSRTMLEKIKKNRK